MGTKRISKTELMVLGMLLRRPLHGYELVDRLSDPVMHTWIQLGRTSIYRSLVRLDSLRLVTHHLERHGSKPERTVYSITEEGRKAFYSAVATALSGRLESMEQFDIGLFYANQLEPADVSAQLETFERSLQEDASLVETALARVQADDDNSLALVLQHRLRVLGTELDFISHLRDALCGRGGLAPGPKITGDLQDNLLSQVLLNLAAARRTGTLRVFVDYIEMGFRIEDGQLTGVIPPEKIGVDESLAQVFSAPRGRFEFASGERAPGVTVPADGHIPVILKGARSAESPELLRLVAPDNGTLLDVKRGYEYETIGVNLTADERRLLAEVDGVRTVKDLAGHLKWSSERVVQVAFPLWCANWIVRSDPNKRELVMSIVEYLAAYAKSIAFVAGKSAVDRIVEEVSFAAEGAGLPNFWQASVRRGSVRFHLDKDALAEAAREYCRLTNAAIEAHMGAGFAADASRGVLDRLGAETRGLLETTGCLSGEPREKPTGER